MKKKLFAIAITFLVVVMVVINSVYVEARVVVNADVGGGSSTKSTTDTTSSNSADWWKKAFEFTQGATSAEYSVSALDDIQNLLLFVGNMVFFVVTVILGVKYIWGSVDSKASVKESLITLIIAAIFFYGWSSIKALFVTNNQLNVITNDYENTAISVYSTVLYVMNFLAIGGIVFIGVKYMLAGAEGKAQLKAKSVPIVLGIVMVYATLTFLNLIMSVIPKIS